MARRLVLMFHGVGRPPRQVGDDERPYWLSEDAFESVVDAVMPRSSSDPDRFRLTFDDGNATDVTYVLPSLLRRGLTAHFFVCAGRIGQPHYLDADSVKALRDEGMRIGSHGWSHIDWRTADDSVLVRELDDARQLLAEVQGAPVNDVAVPFGSYDRRVCRRLRERRYDRVFTSDQGWAGDSWMVPRVACRSDWTGQTVHDLVRTSHPVRQRLVWPMKRLVKRVR